MIATKFSNFKVYQKSLYVQIGILHFLYTGLVYLISIDCGNASHWYFGFQKIFCFIYVRPKSRTGDMMPCPLGSYWIETAVSDQESTMRWKLRETGETLLCIFKKNHHMPEYDRSIKRKVKNVDEMK